MIRLATVIVFCLVVGCGTAPVKTKLPPKPAPEQVPTNLSPAPSECGELGKLADFNYRDLPLYPPDALKSDQQGWVMFTFDVEAGRVVRPAIVSSSPRGVFESSILEWARTLIYPSGKSAKGCRIEYHFKLE
jgi:outer membrane biosynthesis protein TonB